MGCQAFSPGVVGLAKELEGKPFHLVLSHNQRGGLEAALEEAFANGLELFPGNVSVTKFGNHPGIEGTGYVPYYALFGPDGGLLDHHQGGPYHGGNGDAVHDSIRSQVEALPALYLGPGPFEDYPELATRLQTGEDLGSALGELWNLHEADPENQELRGHLNAVNRMLVRKSVDITPLVTRDPDRGLQEWKDLYRSLVGSPWTALVEKGIALVAEIPDGDPLLGEVRAGQRAASKAFVAAERRWLALEPLRGNGGPVRNPRSAVFQRKHTDELQALRDALLALRTDHPGALAAHDSFTFLNLLEPIAKR